MYQNENKIRRHKRPWNCKTDHKWNRRRKTQKGEKPQHGYGVYLKKCKEFDEHCEQYWKSIIPILQNMRSELLALGPRPLCENSRQNIKYCVSLLKIVAETQDALEHGRLTIYPLAKKECVMNFNANLYFAGRHSADDLRKTATNRLVPYWNTTQKGEPVTLNNILFGADANLPSKPASYWLNRPKVRRFTLNVQKPLQI